MKLAKATGTVKRWRNVKNGEELLRLILAYAIENSLCAAPRLGRASPLSELKDTSVLHRLRKAPPPLLERVLAHLLTQRLHAEAAPGPTFRME